MDAALGARMHCAGIVLHGVLSSDQWLAFLHEVTSAIGMAPVASPAIWSYPTEDGKGGTGQTFVLPISESFLALDTWSDHRGAYLFVCSCRGYQTADIDAVAKAKGLRIDLRDDQRFYRELNLT